ncbi:MAG: hypothetical protein Q9226_009103 [Calogaya cf. arnoldii]
MILLPTAVWALCSITLAKTLELNVNDEGTMSIHRLCVITPLKLLLSLYQKRRAGHRWWPGGILQRIARQGSPERADGAPPGNSESRNFASASLFDTLIDYWYYTGDGQYNRLVIELLADSLGNNPPLDHNVQGLWALGAMSAAGSPFTLKPLNGTPPYLSYAQNIFDIQVARWDMGTCNGGLAWKFPDEAESSWRDYKSSFANGILFQ